jgi:predicted TIM-barrel fold metal-dependent hydrolase
MIIDCHTHLFGRWLNLRGLKPRDFVRVMDETGLDKACVFTLEGFFEARGCNDQLAALAKGFESRLYPFATVDPHMGDFAVKDLRRAVKKLGMRGLKVHPWLQAFSLTNEYFLKVVEETIRLNIPIIFHNGSPPYACPTQVGNLANKFPEATLILGEAGLKDLWLDAVAVGKKYPNIYLCPAASPFSAVLEMVKSVPIGKLVFGTDLGFSQKEEVLLEIQKIRSLPLSEPQRELVFSGNISMLVNFEN